MAPRSRGAKRIADAFASPSVHHVCSSCLQTLSKRSYASAATAKANLDSQLPPPITQLSPSGPEASLSPQPLYTIKAGIVLSRPPLITPDPHPFETAFHLYQRRLNERLVLPFTQYFYYRRNTPAFEQWRKHRRERGGAATRDIGKYNAYSPEAWNDEVLVGDETGKPEKILEQLVSEEGRADEFTGQGNPRFAGLRRLTEADEKNDQRSLERRLQRTLYLLVKLKNKGGQAKEKDVGGDSEKWLWRFPSGPVVGFEGLKEAAQRILFSSLGPNMNTFFVGNHPVGHYVARFSSPRPRPSSAPLFIAGSTSSANSQSMEHPSSLATTQVEKASESTPLKQDLAATKALVDGEKTFFMKARIMAGQADVSYSTTHADANGKEAKSSTDTPAPGTSKGEARDKKGVVVDMGLDEIEDFKWLSKDEVEEHVHPDYWIRVKNMLVA
ncbi:uncharacterized protein Z520_05804 [Fonsecaea multimorphosa CBS 102226]|uniref:Large ribosomal subunit protein mL46 n=1 Tax=Fonsecaea multimorphosa CBS 102226 TaxID=1442371 RepID=A0A0D2KP90_9EURO|nr:uncharacterized protein Z520_05804 [Fonsecaea multimorphosa CBS 102226]KIX98503.1 hypothetical protein Z520_05804 [Fonsecaea multimorphosa CBS 102226]OAL24698.1 hypothetical protein AYO22_05487 [Fonsecaea multimorphosa]